MRNSPTRGGRESYKNELLELSLKAVKEGRDYVFDLSLRKTSYEELVGLLYIEVSFESWVKFLGPPLSTSQSLREFLDLK